ncbi:serine/threonine-protein kinase tousled-like 1-B [Styela clava]
MDDLPTIDARRQELLEARFLGSSRQGQTGSESNMSAGSIGGSSDRDSASGYTSTPERPDKEKSEGGRKGKKRKADSSDHKKSSSKKINDYFGASSTVSPSRSGRQDHINLSPQTVLRSPTSHIQQNSNSSNIDFSGLLHQYHQRKITSSKVVKNNQTDITMQDIVELESRSSSLESKHDRKIEDLLHKNSNIECQLQEFKTLVQHYTDQLEKCKLVNRRLLVEKTKAEKKEARKKAMEGRLRLGQFTRQGHSYQETWINGWAFADIDRKRETINKEKEDIEKEKKILNKRKPTNLRNKQAADAEGTFVKPKEVREQFTVQEYHERDEVLRLRLNAVRRDETDLQFELERLERERSLHIRELKRILNEDNSRFNDHPILHNRYLLLNMLGKGGFSEVYKGFDCEHQRYVAIKIHHLNRDWHEQKKMDYARHANREADIHRSVDHPRIVRLFDRFEVDINTFCTVMEYCEGNDLDFYLKQHKSMSEKEARTIIMQVVSALKYLNTLERPVIHYDLKPGNILMCDGAVCGNIKITDFGLSKQFDEGLSPREGMDLTSQGAGTYWYLPPECFVRGPGGHPPKIDNKVDVWSVGVIFYQCLYGKKPFGHNLTQEAILKQNTILRATEVTFPPKPSISNEAKSFIKSCLMYHKEERSDVFALAGHSYFTPPPTRRQTAVSTNATNGT